ncbi:capsular polysaccharide biosynthesis protein [Geminocystis sp. NIES-3708]|nr:capsular polysaccharide biosynthesis protein [Geminocystis sp. NIES-3708]
MANLSDGDLLSYFTRIDPINKEELRQFPENFLAQVDDIVYRGVTSGTTSEAFIYFRDSQWNQQRKIGLKNFLNWWNIDDNLPIMNINSRLFPLRENDYSLIGIIDNFFWQSLKISTEKPVILRGFPSRLCEVAIFANKNIKISSIKAIICTGEHLFPHQKKLLEDTFSAPIINEYGSQECGVYGFSCPLCSNIHIDEKRCFVEVKNKVLIVTDLYSDIMPLIRYKNGDLAEIESDNFCPNGSINLKFLGRIEEEIISIKNYPIIPEISYYRTFFSTNKNQKIIGYLTTKVNEKDNMESIIKIKLTDILDQKDVIKYQKFSYPEDFYQANIINSESLLSETIKLNYHENYLEQLSEILKSRRWIFYSLPRNLYQLVNNNYIAKNIDSSKQLRQDKLFLFLNVLMNNHKADFEEQTIKIFSEYQNKQKLYLIYLDLLIIALFLEQKELWIHLKNIKIKEQIILDSLSYRLLLTSISQAISSARTKKESLLITKLTPLLPLFISDLDFCQINNLNCLPSILVHWSILLGCLTDDTIINSAFFRRPLVLEKREIKIKNKNNINNKSNHLSELSLEELKELGIEMVLFNLKINPSIFLDRIQLKLSKNKSQEISKKLGFIPFMRYLAKSFLVRGDRKKAYYCLLMSQDISLMQDDFESISKVYNFKQKIM